MIRRLMWRLYHIEESIEANTHLIKAKNKELGGLRKEQVTNFPSEADIYNWLTICQTEYAKSLSSARAAQARVRGEVMKKETAIKKAEKTLNLKVVSFPVSSSVET